MSVKLMDMVFESSLPPTLKLVMLSLADHANDDGRSIYPSVARLSRKTSLNKRTVQLTLSKLRKAKVLVIEKQSSRYMTNEYAIIVRNLKKLVRGESDSPLNPARGESDSLRGESDSPDPSVNHQLTPSYEGARGKPPRDPRSSHPAIRAVRTVTHHYPAKAVYDTVISQLGESPNVAKMQACFEAWCLKGYNTRGLGWLDWYPDLIPANGRKPNDNTRPKQANGSKPNTVSEEGLAFARRMAGSDR